MNKQTTHVWYASYGSNISRERFLCYILGGQPEGSQDCEKGCSDQTLPLKEKTYKINHPLYFTKNAQKWQGGGVAFIGKDKEENEHTFGKMYLITVDQFIEVVHQENKKSDIKINLDDVMNERSLIITASWYNNILFLGEEEGYPIFTFTSEWDINQIKFTKPSQQYLKTIIKGLKSFMTKSECIEYLSEKRGILGNYQNEELEKLFDETLES